MFMLLFSEHLPQNQPNSPQLQSLRQAVQQKQQRIAVDTIVKGGTPLIQDLHRFFRQLFRRDMPGFHTVDDSPKPLGIAGIQLCIFAKAIQCCRGCAKHGCSHRPGTKHRHPDIQDLKLHPQGIGVLIQRSLGHSIDPCKGQRIQRRQFTGSDQNTASRLQ